MGLNVEVVTQEKKLFQVEDADLVLVPGSEGQLGILPNHSPLITTLRMGELVIRKSGAEEVFAVSGGVADVRPDKVLILADAADFAHEINIEAMEEARARAEQSLQDKSLASGDEAALMAQLKLTEHQISVARKAQNQGGGLRIRVLADDE